MSGNSGIDCVQCGLPIPLKRLLAMPLAEFCVKCQPEPRLLTDVDVPDAMAVVEVDLSEVYGWGR